jgi:hypothetical protein
MSSTTAGGIPVPDDTDAVAQGAAAMRAMAGKFGASAAGTATLPLNTAQTAGAVAVTFPSGRFTAVPAVTVTRTAATAWSSLPQLYWAQSITTTGFQAGGIAAVTSAGIALSWIAVQPS